MIRTINNPSPLISHSETELLFTWTFLPGTCFLSFLSKWRHWQLIIMHLFRNHRHQPWGDSLLHVSWCSRFKCVMVLEDLCGNSVPRLHRRNSSWHSAEQLCKVYGRSIRQKQGKRGRGGSRELGKIMGGNKENNVSTSSEKQCLLEKLSHLGPGARAAGERREMVQKIICTLCFL